MWDPSSSLLVRTKPVDLSIKNYINPYKKYFIMIDIDPIEVVLNWWIEGNPDSPTPTRARLIYQDQDLPIWTVEFWSDGQCYRWKLVLDRGEPKFWRV